MACRGSGADLGFTHLEGNNGLTFLPCALCKLRKTGDFFQPLDENADGVDAVVVDEVLYIVAHGEIGLVAGGDDILAADVSVHRCTDERAEAGRAALRNKRRASAVDRNGRERAHRAGPEVKLGVGKAEAVGADYAHAGRTAYLAQLSFPYGAVHLVGLSESGGDYQHAARAAGRALAHGLDDQRSLDDDYRKVNGLADSAYAGICLVAEHRVVRRRDGEYLSFICPCDRVAHKPSAVARLFVRSDYCYGLRIEQPSYRI